MSENNEKADTDGWVRSANQLLQQSWMFVHLYAQPCCQAYDQTSVGRLKAGLLYGSLLLERLRRLDFVAGFAVQSCEA